VLPRMRRANCISLGWIVTRRQCNAQRFVSSNKLTRNASDASCSASTAVNCQRSPSRTGMANSRTKRWNGAFRISRSVDFCSLRISRIALVPGRVRRLDRGDSGPGARLLCVGTLDRGELDPLGAESPRGEMVPTEGGEMWLRKFLMRTMVGIRRVV